MGKSKRNTLTAPVQKNDETELDINGISHDGAGIGRVEGYTLFVHGALPGERVRVKVVKVQKNFGYGKLLDVLRASPDRVEPPCRVFRQCGGCQLQHASYEAQLRYKRQRVIDNLQRIGGLEDVIVHPVIGMEEPWRYRNKAQVPIGAANDQAQNEKERSEKEAAANGGKRHSKQRSPSKLKLIAGFYALGSHRIIDTDECLIQHEQNDRVMVAVKRIGEELGIEPYDELTHTGLLRHVVARTSWHTGETMVVLVTNGDKLPHEKEWIARIRRELPEVVSICQNINTKRTNVIFGETTKVLWGRETIEDRIGNVRFAISARSFYQVNPVQTKVLYEKALEYAQLTGTETVMDAYCGIGTISLFLAEKAAQVYGVEVVPEAVYDARRNAELNGFRNVHFEIGKAEEVIPRWKEEGIKADVIVVDPPRKGCDPALLETMIAMKPNRIVYVSCNPATLARDLRILEDGGFRTVEVQPVDMFPHTTHVECCVSIEKK